MFLSPSFECKTDMIDGVLVSEMSRFELDHKLIMNYRLRFPTWMCSDVKLYHFKYLFVNLSFTLLRPHITVK